MSKKASTRYCRNRKPLTSPQARVRFRKVQTKMKSIVLSRGSEWRRSDLHVHSPTSALNNQFPKLSNGDPDWEAYIQALEALPDVPVIGITDYFSIDGYKKVKEFKQKGRLNNIALILPNIEFRIDKIIET